MSQRKCRYLFISNTYTRFPDHPVSQLFQEVMKENGFLRVENFDDAELLVSYDLDEDTLSKLPSDKLVLKKLVLLRQETDVVFSRQYDQRWDRVFDLILDIGRNKDLSPQSLSFPYVYLESHPRQTPILELNTLVERNEQLGLYSQGNWMSRPLSLTFIGSNKLHKSKNSRYRRRRTAINNLAPLGLEVYGRYWESISMQKLEDRTREFIFSLQKGHLINPRFLLEDFFWRCKTPIHGELLNKSEALKSTKFNLVVENSSNHLTEKIFDSILFGAVPIYDGPDLDKFEVAPDIVVPIRQIMESRHRESFLSSKYVDEIRQNGIELITNKQSLATLEAKTVYVSIATRIRSLVDPDSNS